MKGHLENIVNGFLPISIILINLMIMIGVAGRSPL